MSDAPALAVIESGCSVSWRAVLEGAVRAEFLGSPLIPPAGSPLAAPECGVDGCPRAGDRVPWGRFETRLCQSHWERWVNDGRPERREDWLSEQPAPQLVRLVERCVVAGCERSAAADGLCGSHSRQWLETDRPPLERFACSAIPAAACDACCRARDCGFPVSSHRSHGLCDAHSARFKAWRRDHDRSVERYLDWLGAREDAAVLVRLPLTGTPLLSLELRFALQCRHDEGGGFIHLPRWRGMVGRLDDFGVQSLFDHDREWWSAQRTNDGRVPAWMYYVNYAWGTLFALRVRCGLADPWAPDVWHTRWLPIERLVGREGRFDWRPIAPVWLRELSKRWARHRLRGGISVAHVNSVRLAVVRLVEFCQAAGWLLDDPGCLTRELFDAFLDDVRFLGVSVDHKRLLLMDTLDGDAVAPQRHAGW
ncbi:MAG: hypothetical protein ACLP50_10415 [Solirubrobacteraceae bacterium]